MTALFARRLQTLTDRQVEVYHLIRTGHPTSKIADKLGIQWGTAKTHRKMVNRKLGFGWRTQTQIL